MFNGTRRKSASPIGASPSLDLLAFIRTVKGGAGARKQLLPAAKSTCSHSFPGAMETSSNSYVMSSRRHVRTFAFITPSVTLDALGPGQGVEQSFPSWALIPASGRAGRRESLLLVEPSPCVPIPVLGALIGGSPSDPTCWVCSLGFTRKVGGALWPVPGTTSRP